MIRTVRRGDGHRPRIPGPISFSALVGLAAFVLACGPSVPPELQPDELLRTELGLTDDDEVHSVRITGGEVETVDPQETVVTDGVWVQFVTTDWRVHEVRFELDSLPEPARAFLTDTDQVGSPPLVNLDARFVVTFQDAPTGRYPFVVEGNGGPGRGVVVVRPNP